MSALFATASAVVVFLILLGHGRRMRRLEYRILALEEVLAAKPSVPAATVALRETGAAPDFPSRAGAAPHPAAASQPAAGPTEPDGPAKSTRPSVAAAPEDCPATGGSRWGMVLGKLPFWVGAAALVGGVLFLLAFSMGGFLLSSPPVRVALGFLLGIGFLAAASWRRFVPKDVSEGLQAAGVGTLYLSTISACTLHGIIGPGLAFLLVTAISGYALFLGSRGGPLLAYVGLAGGFLTPMLIRSADPSPWLMFGYLGGLSLTAAYLASLRRWGGLGLAAVAGGGLWVVAWAISPLGGAPIPGILLALLWCVLAVSLRAKCPAPSAWAKAIPLALSFGVAALATALLVRFTPSGAALATAVLCVMGVAAVALSSRRRDYADAPALVFASGLVAAILIRPDAGQALPLLAAMAVAFGVAPALLADRVVMPRWLRLGSPIAILGTMAALAYSVTMRGGSMPVPVWGLASAIAAFGYAALVHARPDGWRAAVGARPVAVGPPDAFAAAAWGFGSLAVVQLADGAEWSWATLALVAVAAVLFDRRLPTAAMPRMAALIAAAATLPTLPLPGAAWLHADPVTGFAFPLVGALVAASLLLASRLSGSAKGDPSPFWLLQVVTGLAVAGVAYCVARWIGAGSPAFPPVAWAWDGWGLGLVPLAIALAGAWLVREGRSHGTVGVEIVGVGGVLAAQVWVVLLSGLALNPLLGPIPVGSWPLLNALPLIFGVPAALLVASALRPGWPRSVLGLGGAVALGFLLVTCLVRQAFHGTVLAGHPLTQAETYSYTVVWLAYAGAVLAAGVSRRSRILCDGGMMLMLLVGAKLFVWDAFALGGLWRVVAFLGFGLALMALGHWYQKLGVRLREPRVG